MKILLINKYYYHIGGIEEFTRAISTSPLISKTLCCSSPESFGNNRTYGSNIDIKKTNFVLFKTPISFSFIFALIRDYFRYDCIHLNTPYPVAEVLLFFLSFMKKRKIVITYHSDIVKQKVVFTILKPCIVGLLKRSDVIVVTSPFMKDNSLISRFKEKVEVIPIGQPDYSNGLVRDYSENSFGIFVGRLVYYKGIFVLLEAISRFHYPIKIVGSGYLKNDILQYIREHKLEEWVELLGTVEDETLIDLYKKSSIFLFPSIEKTEAFGIVQVQAMSFGLPIINTNLPTGVPWVARQNQEAITITPNNVDELVHALKLLSEKTELRKKLGSSGRARYEELFMEKVMIKNYENIYKSLNF